jgi:hypothetical protein
LLVQARIIAENEITRRAIREQRLGVIERLLAEARLSDDEYFQQKVDKLIVAIFDKFQAYLPPLAQFRGRYTSERIAAILEDYLPEKKSIEAGKFAKSFLDQQPTKPPKRDEYEVLEEAAPDLDTLERYENRAWSRQIRAIREFIEIKRLAGF